MGDFIEDGREYAVCREMGESLYLSLDNASAQNRKEVLKSYLLKIIDFTIEYLNKRGMAVNSRLLVAKKDIIANNLHV